MNVSWQDMAVAVVVIVAAASILRRMVRRVSSRRPGGCAGCSCCEKAAAGLEPTWNEAPSECTQREAGESATVR